MVTEFCGGTLQEEGGGVSAGLYTALKQQQTLQVRRIHVRHSLFFFHGLFFSQRSHPCLQFLLARFPSLAPPKCVKVVFAGAISSSQKALLFL